jgi:hypothetical protein
MWSSLFALPTCSPGDQIKEDEVGGSCGMCGKRGMHAGFWWRNLKRRANLEDLGIDRKVILKKENG